MCIRDRFTDVNGNGVWDPSENFIDENGNGIADKYKYTNFPNSQHLLGTDNQGRDVLSRLIYGFNISITFAIVCCFLSYIIGIIIGGTLGYFGGKVDLFGLRIIEIYGSIPFLFMLMILATFIKPNVYILASMYVFLTGWIGITWYVRGEFLREKSKDYVSAAVSMGQSHWNVMFRHILPNSLTPVITFAPFAIIGYISALVSLDYLGFGLQPPTPSWGELMAQGRTNFQLEKFIGLNTHNVSVTFEHILKERRIMASGYMGKLIEMKERVREFDWKWANHQDKTQPLIYDVGTESGKKVLCWYDLEELNLTHYLRSSELEIRDRLHQMEHMDKMMDKLVEQNGGVSPNRAQFLEENEEYWDTRLAEQALDDLMASRTGTVSYTHLTLPTKA
mgnify:CR=1 FL=1